MPSFSGLVLSRRARAAKRPCFQALYAQLGVRSALVRACHDLPSRVELRCDGQLVDLPGTVRALVQATTTHAVSLRWRFRYLPLIFLSLVLVTFCALTAWSVFGHASIVCRMRHFLSQQHGSYQTQKIRLANGRKDGDDVPPHWPPETDSIAAVLCPSNRIAATTASIIACNINSYGGGSKLWAVEVRGPPSSLSEQATRL